MWKAINIAVVMMFVISTAAAQNSQDRNGYADAATVSLKSNMTAETESFSPATTYSYPADDFRPGVVRVGPRTTYLKEGLRTDEVVRLLGKPASISEGNENGITVTTYMFQRGEGRVIIADFVSGVLVRSRTETRLEKVVEADQ